MNPFDKLLQAAQNHSDIIQSASSLQIQIGDYMVDTTYLLTDDLAVIFQSFSKDENMIGELVDYAERLPYSIKIDLMFYLSSDKKSFKKLKKIKVFKNFIDGFAASIADLKLQQG